MEAEAWAWRGEGAPSAVLELVEAVADHGEPGRVYHEFADGGLYEVVKDEDEPPRFRLVAEADLATATAMRDSIAILAQTVDPGQQAEHLCLNPESLLVGRAGVPSRGKTIHEKTEESEGSYIKISKRTAVLIVLVAVILFVFVAGEGGQGAWDIIPWL